VISLGTGYFPPGNKIPRLFAGWLNWAVAALLDASEEQQPELVERHFPGILQRYDWQLPAAIDIADTRSIPALAAVGQQAALGMDWKSILG
jgi:hypothetical protein